MATLLRPQGQGVRCFGVSHPEAREQKIFHGSRSRYQVLQLSNEEVERIIGGFCAAPELMCAIIDEHLRYFTTEQAQRITAVIGKCRLDTFQRHEDFNTVKRTYNRLKNYYP